MRDLVELMVAVVVCWVAGMLVAWGVLWAIEEEGRQVRAGEKDARTMIFLGLEG